MNGSGIGVAIVLASVLSGAQALGFCRKTTCEVSPMPAACEGTVDQSDCSNEGLRLHWGKPCLSFSVQRDGSRKRGIDADLLEQLVLAAFDRWSKVECPDGGRPNLYVEAYPQSTCDAVGYKTDGPNQNLWVFRDEPWQHETGAESAMALTVLSVNVETGEIYDADVELNSQDYEYTTGDDVVATDLFSIALHESGHALGIGHSEWATSTMADGYQEGTTEPRTLEADDRNAICAIMPPGDLPAHCDPEPRNGFSTRCESDAGGCSVSVSGSPRKRSIASWFCALLLAVAARQKREGRRFRRGAQTVWCFYPKVELSCPQRCPTALVNSM